MAHKTDETPGKYDIEAETAEAMTMLGTGYSEMPPMVQGIANLPKTVQIERTSEMPGGLYRMFPLNGAELAFDGKAYLYKSSILCNQWYLFVPVPEETI